METQLTILGNSSASPTRERNQSGQYLRMAGRTILIDCGEGTQSRILKYNLSYQKIEVICVSHMHGDHYLGLPGLLNTMSLNARTTPITIIGPAALPELMMHHFSAAETLMKFPIEWKVVPPGGGQVFAFDGLEIEAVPLRHRISCFAYIFRETFSERVLNPEACQNAEIPKELYAQIKSGSDFHSPDGRLIKNESLTFPGNPPFSYGYITDTLFVEENIPRFSGIQVLYHEATFLEDMALRAEQTFHSTAEQAARFAQGAGVEQLLIGHFSSRYKQLESHLVEARRLFPGTILAEEGETFTFR